MTNPIQRMQFVSRPNSFTQINNGGQGNNVRNNSRQSGPHGRRLKTDYC